MIISSQAPHVLCSSSLRRPLPPGDSDSDSDYSPDCKRVKTTPSVRGIKKQARYVPGVPMTKEELKEWRKEARRVRNRESAAASRRKTADRIGALETRLAEAEAKYQAALARIAELENGTTTDMGTHTSLTIVSPPQSPVISPLSREATATTATTTSLITAQDKDDDVSSSELVEFNYPQLLRPTAVGVTVGVP